MEFPNLSKEFPKEFEGLVPMAAYYKLLRYTCIPGYKYFLISPDDKVSWFRQVRLRLDEEGKAMCDKTIDEILNPTHEPP